MSYEVEPLQSRGGASALRAYGVAIWPNLLWSALAWPSLRVKKRMVAGQTARLEAALGNVCFGSEETFTHLQRMSALPPKADIGTHPCDVCFVPKADSCTAAKGSLFDHLVGVEEKA
jgi:hypothetical protein